MPSLQNSTFSITVGDIPPVAISYCHTFPLASYLTCRLVPLVLMPPTHSGLVESAFLSKPHHNGRGRTCARARGKPLAHSPGKRESESESERGRLMRAVEGQPSAVALVKGKRERARERASKQASERAKEREKETEREGTAFGSCPRQKQKQRENERERERSSAIPLSEALAKERESFSVEPSNKENFKPSSWRVRV